MVVVGGGGEEWEEADLRDDGGGGGGGEGGGGGREAGGGTPLAFLRALFSGKTSGARWEGSLTPPPADTVATTSLSSGHVAPPSPLLSPFPIAAGCGGKRKSWWAIQV